MSRLPDLPASAMSAEQRAVAEEIVSGPHGRIVGPYHAWLQSPELARRARALSEFIRFQSSLPRRLSELAILVTGRHWKAEFEFWAHARLGREAGLDAALIQALAAGKRPVFTDAALETVYDLATELYEAHRVSDPTYTRAVDLLGVPGVVELVATVGYYSLVSLTLNAFQVGLPPGETSPFPDA
jgi:4-carboxymuconolactone decarboxylase